MQAWPGSSWPNFESDEKSALCPFCMFVPPVERCSAIPRFDLEESFKFFVAIDRGRLGKTLPSKKIGIHFIRNIEN